MYLRGNECPYCLAQAFFSGSDLARVCRTDARGNGVESEAISTPFLTRYCMESSTRLFTCLRESTSVWLVEKFSGFAAI